MTQLISNVLMQPKPDAVERPLTLIEKLERERKTHKDLMLQSPTLQDSAYYNGVTVGFMGAIDIVKQHSDWIPVSDLPKEEKDWLVRFKKEDCFGLTMEVSKFYLEAQKFDCFHSKVTHYMALPIPLSEVQNV